MTAHLHARSLHRTEVLSVTDVKCSCPRGGAGPEESSPETSIAIARSGVFVRHVGSRAILADANTASIFRSGVDYRVSHPCDGGDECTSLRFAQPVLRELLTAFDPEAAERPEPAPGFDAAPCPARTYLLQTLLVRALAARWPDPVEVDETGLRVAAQLLREGYHATSQRLPRGRAPATHRAHQQLAHRAAAALHARLADRLDLGAIARDAHASPYHLTRVFRQQTGHTLSTYLAALRVRQAIREVLDGEQDLTSAALRAGFFDQSHLTNACRRQLGLTPSQFRQLDRRTLREMSNLVQEPPRAVR